MDEIGREEYRLVMAEYDRLALMEFETTQEWIDDALMMCIALQKLAREQ